MSVFMKPGWMKLNKSSAKDFLIEYEADDAYVDHEHGDAGV